VHSQCPTLPWLPSQSKNTQTVAAWRCAQKHKNIITGDFCSSLRSPVLVFGLLSELLVIRSKQEEDFCLKF